MFEIAGGIILAALLLAMLDEAPIIAFIIVSVFLLFALPTVFFTGFFCVVLFAVGVFVFSLLNRISNKFSSLIEQTLDSPKLKATEDLGSLKAGAYDLYIKTIPAITLKQKIKKAHYFNVIRPQLLNEVAERKRLEIEATVLAARNASAAHSEKMKLQAEEVEKRIKKSSTETLLEIKNKLSKIFKDYENVHFFHKNDEIAIVIITPNQNKRVFKITAQVQTEISSTTDRVNRMVNNNAPFFLNDTFTVSPILARVSYIVSSSNENPSTAVFANENALSNQLKNKIIEALASK
jgi:hypothetical protein